MASMHDSQFIGGPLDGQPVPDWAEQERVPNIRIPQVDKLGPGSCSVSVDNAEPQSDVRVLRYNRTRWRGQMAYVLETVKGR